jgi:hypothetical protein
MFNEECILIVEDEAIIAYDLADTITELGGCPLGPYASVVEALVGIELHQVHGAILDATLLDRDITPVAARLAAVGIAMVVHSGTGLPKELAALHPSIPLILKPANPIQVAARLVEEMRKMRR